MDTTTILQNARAAESGHWYDLTGKPAYEVFGKNGEARATTLRDARKLTLVPSVSAIIKCAAAPMLENWKSQQVLLAALTLPRHQDEPDADFIRRVMADSREQSLKARNRGTAIHAAIQGHYEGIPPSEEMWPIVKSVQEAVEGAFGPCDWIPEASFAHPLGYGGKCDLHAHDIVIDFKTKEFSDGSKKLAWDEQAMQLAAYARGFGMPDARCANVFVSTSVPGLVVIHEWLPAEIENAWGMFTGLLNYWQHKNGYWPNSRKE